MDQGGGELFQCDKTRFYPTHPFTEYLNQIHINKNHTRNYHTRYTYYTILSTLCC